MTADGGFLGVALAPFGQFLALALSLDDALDDALRRNGCAGHRGLVAGKLGRHLFLFIGVIGQQLGVERLGQLGAVAVEGIGLETEAPGEHVGGLAVRHARLVRHVDGLGDGPGDKGLARCHHANVAFNRQEALAPAAAGTCAIEDRQMLVGEMWRAFQRHGTAHVLIGCLDVLLGEPQMVEQLEGGIGERRRWDLQRVCQELFAQRPSIERELDVEGRLERGVEPCQRRFSEALGLERGVVDGGRLDQRAVADSIGLDLGNLGCAIAERA